MTHKEEFLNENKFFTMINFKNCRFITKNYPFSPELAFFPKNCFQKLTIYNFRQVLNSIPTGLSANFCYNEKNESSKNRDENLISVFGYDDEMSRM